MPTMYVFFFSSRRRHTRCSRDWSSDVCSSDLRPPLELREDQIAARRLHVAQHADDVHLKFLELDALKNGFADALHARTHLVQRHERRGGRQGNPVDEGEQQGETETS